MSDQTILKFDYAAVEGETVTAVLGQADGNGNWWSVAILLGSRALVLRVDADSDQISVALEAAPEGADWATVEPMHFAIGSELGWCWIGRNYRGYLDMFTVSFSGLEPQFLFIGMASAIQLRRVSPPN
jgi:hypothetical protein